MQNYISLRLNIVPCEEDITDLMAAFLGDIGYESFLPDENGLTAYIKTELYNRAAVEEIISDFPYPSKFILSEELIKGEDWNQEWEKNYFKPIVIDNLVVVHSSFHKDVPSALHDIVIDPKMAFGTGHHSTTSQMMRHILEMDLKGKSVIDMGTGTGILSILSKMRGAEKVTGIEIDPYAWENAVENSKLNNMEINMICGDAKVLKEISKADILLANINRNIILEDLQSYLESLNPNGELYLSGFYEEDIPIIETRLTPYGYKIDKVLVENNWAAVRVVKTN